jgi:hypothetical protein
MTFANSLIIAAVLLKILSACARPAFPFALRLR